MSHLSHYYSSVGKESTCNAGDPGLIPGSGRFPGEGIGYPLQYSWASLVTQLVKNPLAMRVTWVRSLGWKDPLRKGKATRSSILAWRIPQTEQPMGSQRVGHDQVTFFFTLRYQHTFLEQSKLRVNYSCAFPRIYLFIFLLLNLLGSGRPYTFIVQSMDPLFCSIFTY